MPGAKPRSTLVLGQPTSALTLDPHLHDEESTHSALSHFYERLVAFGPELELQPELATAWASPSDTVWRFTLRGGVRFHDSAPCEAPDVVASLQRALRLPGSQVAHYLQNVVEVRAAGPLTVEVVTSAPSPLLLNKLAFVAIVPRSTPMAPITRPVGTGPYQFVSGAAREVLQGRAFDGYWGPRPAFTAFRVVPLPDAPGRARAVVERRADVVVRFPFEFTPWARGQKGMHLASRPGLGVGLLCFSGRKGSRFADRRVREAFALAIDRSRLVDEVERPFTALAEQFVPRSVFGYAPPARSWRHDPAGARALLAEAGFPSGLEVTLVTPDTQASLGQRLALLLAEAGIRVRLESPPWDAFYARWSSGGLELFSFAYNCGTGDASDLLDSFFRTRGPSAGTLNSSGYSNERFDRLVEEAGRVLDPETRRRLMGEALALLREDLPAIPLLSRGYLYAVGDEVAWTPRMDRRARAQDMRPRDAS